MEASFRVDLPVKDRLLILCGPADLAEMVRTRFPDLEVSTAETLLEGISSLAKEEARAVLLFVDGTQRKLDAAIAGLREAGGSETRLLLCCTSELEPIVQDAITAGADDYLICPLDGRELDKAIGYARSDEWQDSEDPEITTADLSSLTEVLARIEDGPQAVADRLCELIRRAVRVDEVEILIEGYVAGAGLSNHSATLELPLAANEQTIGKLRLCARADSAFSGAEVEMLRTWASLSAAIIDNAQRQNAWRRLAGTDDVTGLSNRRLVRERLANLIQNARADQSRVTLLLFDLDNFKSFNDSYGHPSGDLLLREIGSICQKCCRSRDLVGRYGGDEFAVVFWDAEPARVEGSRHPDAAIEVLRRFRHALDEDHVRLMPEGADRSTFQLSISGGLATYPWDASTMEELIERADAALMQAKADGKNQILVIKDSDLPADDASDSPTDS
jgi:diguanylate cyclase (GGDEF)-like protein